MEENKKQSSTSFLSTRSAPHQPTLFKEYAICDLTYYKSGKYALVLINVLNIVSDSVGARKRTYYRAKAKRYAGTNIATRRQLSHMK